MASANPDTYSGISLVSLPGIVSRSLHMQLAILYPGLTKCELCEFAAQILTYSEDTYLTIYGLCTGTNRVYELYHHA